MSGNQDLLPHAVLRTSQFGICRSAHPVSGRSSNGARPKASEGRGAAYFWEGRTRASRLEVAPSRSAPFYELPMRSE
eukprot:15467831-Alexandrium_andersonii.AAC.1